MPPAQKQPSLEDVFLVVAWLGVLGIVVLFTLALTWLAVSAGLAAKSPDGAGASAYPLLFLPFVSSGFVPTDGMPGPVEWFAEHQPVTSIVNTLRNLYADQPLGNDVWTALAWCIDLIEATDWDADDPRLPEVADRLVAMFEEDAEPWSEDELTDFALGDDLVALLDEVFVTSVPFARRLLHLLEERGWRGWTQLERISPP